MAQKTRSLPFSARLSSPCTSILNCLTLPGGVPAEEVAEPALPEPDGSNRLDDIQAQVGFPVYFPTFIPSGFTVHERRAYIEGEMAIAAAYYNTPLTSPDSPIVLYQALGSPVLNYTENQFSQHETVNVRGQSGEWVTLVSFNLYPKHLGAYGIQSNLLIWEEDGYTFIIQSNSLSLELSLRIAESLMLPE